MNPLLPFWLLSELLGDGPIVKTLSSIANGQATTADTRLNQIVNKLLRLIDNAISEMERSRALATPSTAKELDFQNLKDTIYGKFKQELYSIQKDVENYQIASAKALENKNNRSLFDHIGGMVDAAGANIARAINGDNDPYYQRWIKQEPGYWKWKAEQADNKASQLKQQVKSAINQEANRLSQSTQGIQGEDK